MKKLFLSACVALVAAFSLNAQNLSYRAEIGGNITGKYLKGGEVPGKHGPNFGLRAGVGLEYKLAPQLYLASGLNYRMSGVKSDLRGVKKPIGGGKFVTLDNDNIQRGHNLSLPINFGARFQVAPSFALSLEGGPFIAYTFSSKSTYGTKVTNNLEKDRKALELGAGVSIAGELMNRYYLRLGTDWGLTDTQKNPMGTLKKMTNEVYLSLGIRF